MITLEVAEVVGGRVQLYPHHPALPEKDQRRKVGKVHQSKGGGDRQDRLRMQRKEVQEKMRNLSTQRDHILSWHTCLSTVWNRHPLFGNNASG